MMHLVTYTMNPKRDITFLMQELQRSASWAHPIDDSWIIVSMENSWQLYGRLSPYLLSTDRLLIVEIMRESDLPQGILLDGEWTWINAWKQAAAGARSALDAPPSGGDELTAPGG